MTITDSPRTDAPAAPATAVDAFVPFAAQVGAQFAGYSAAHDRDGTFVTEAYDVLRESGYLRLAVPVECGGMGATIAQVAAAQAELARHCPSAALAVAMHLHITLFAAWRHRRDMPGAEALLRKVAEQGAVYVSTGGSDFTNPNGTAVKVDGGYRVSGRKVFASQAPAGDVLSAFFTYEDPQEGARVLAMGIPFTADGFEVVETWDAMGMRGTGSHDLQLTDVFVSDAQVMSNRPYGVVDPPLMVILAHAMPVIAAVYLGVAEAARDRLVAMLRDTDKATDAIVQRQVGLVDHKLRVARWSLFAAMAEVGDDPTPSMDNLVTVMLAKRAVAEEAVSACDVILEAAGGMAYSRRAGLEQAVRDVRGIVFHPFTPEKTLVHAGRVALGQPAASV
jgi:alkylation response protein AidB-like acyl-CoA dehydrogenase